MATAALIACVCLVSKSAKPEGPAAQEDNVREAVAASTPQVERYRFHCAKDTTEINELLARLHEIDKPVGEVAIEAARMLEGRPYVAHTLEGTPERVLVNIHSFDCIILVENCWALASASRRPGATWHDFIETIEDLRYRGGHCDGTYPSRLHYSADWVADNAYRGNVEDITPYIPSVRSQIKTLNYMTSHRDSYEALKDDETFNRIREIEYGFFSMKIPYIPKSLASGKDVTTQMLDGDMVVFMTNIDGLDSTHVAMIRMIDGKPYMVHASMKKGAVVFETEPLSSYFKLTQRKSPGFRLVRFKR